MAAEEVKPKLLATVPVLKVMEVPVGNLIVRVSDCERVSGKVKVNLTV